jgi:hypothetical protein
MIHRLFIILLIPLFLINSWSYIVSPSIVCAAEEKITPLPPETVEAEPVEPPKKPVIKDGGFGWGTLLLIVLIGGGVAVITGSGKSSSSSSSSGGGGSTGSGGTIPVTW